jgi:hypothetical protein
VTTAVRITVSRAEVAMTIAFEAHDCPTCGVIYAISEEFGERRRSDGKTFYCPNGHTVSYHGDMDKLREQLRTAERDARWYKDAERRAADRAQTAERSAAAYKGQTTRLRKRAITGTCAFCHRHFADVERHVATKHPDETP